MGDSRDTGERPSCGTRLPNSTSSEKAGASDRPVADDTRSPRGGERTLAGHPQSFGTVADVLDDEAMIVSGQCSQHRHTDQI